ncbi:hypothetical protein [Cellulomonas sp. KRMCY2]|uniref:hypothetical protein n=1 Tax=Cellulomonas sp. KRMCY2 TaxID=1304865 RepID=UPI0012DC4B34|nr:hypothetical protein [Cellulomonas sp. KRMCY2]
MARGATLVNGGAAMVALGVVACVIAFPTAPHPELGGPVTTSFVDQVPTPAPAGGIQDVLPAAQVPAASDADALPSDQGAAVAAAPALPATDHAGPAPALDDRTARDPDRTAPTTWGQGDTTRDGDGYRERTADGTAYHDGAGTWEPTGDGMLPAGRDLSGDGDGRDDGRGGR